MRFKTLALVSDIKIFREGTRAGAEFAARVWALAPATIQPKRKILMAGETTLSVSIDASEAKKGAAEFSRVADDIKRKAAEMGRAIDQGSRAFRNMRAAANDNSRALGATACY